MKEIREYDVQSTKGGKRRYLGKDRARKKYLKKPSSVRPAGKREGLLVKEKH